MIDRFDNLDEGVDDLNNHHIGLQIFLPELTRTVQFDGEQISLLSLILKKVSTDKFSEFVTQNMAIAQQFAQFDAICLDPITIGCLLEQGNDNERMPMRQPKGNTAVNIFYSKGAFPYQQYIPTMAIILEPKGLNLENPASIDWRAESVIDASTSLTNLLRILARGAISNAVCSRNYPIKPSSSSLGQLLIFIQLSAMLNLCNGLTLPKPEDFNNQIQRTFRGLYYNLLCIMASGAAKPLLMCWQLVADNPNLELISTNEAIFYSMMLKTFPYTGWNMKNIKRNIAMLIIKIINKKIYAITDPMRKNLTETKKIASINYIERREKQLKWLDLAVSVLMHICEIYFKYILEKKSIEQMDTYEIREIMKRLLSYYEMNDDMNQGKITGLRIYNFVKLASIKNSAKWEFFPNILEEALNITAKRSGVFADTKKLLSDALKNKDIRKANELYIKLMQEKQELAMKFDKQTCKIQNEKGILNDIQLNECAHALSDAEQTRFNFSLHNAPAHTNVEKSNILNYILGVSDDKIHENNNILVETNDDEKEQDKYLMTLQKVEGSGKALQMYNNIGKLSLMKFVEENNLNVSYEDIILFFEFTGILANDSDNMLKNIVRTLLLGWQNPPQSEMDALTLFTL